MTAGKPEHYDQTSVSLREHHGTSNVWSNGVHAPTPVQTSVPTSASIARRSRFVFLASRSISVYHHCVEKQVILKKHEDKRLLAGHQWVFSNEIAAVEGSPVAGDIVEVRDCESRLLGIGFFNPHSLISVRHLSCEQTEIGHTFFERRIGEALSLRNHLFPAAGSFRLVNGESDFLPGLIIDKYNEFVSLQTLSYGMDKRIPIICDVLESLLHPKGIVERNDTPLRTLEHLPERRGVIRGVAEHTIISEYGAKFDVDLLKGQKTGFFLDQRENRKLVREHARDAVVLDCFCNEGGFAINALLGGAKHVSGIDISEVSVERAQLNAVINQKENVDFRTADVFDILKDFSATKRLFDIVILDPPLLYTKPEECPECTQGIQDDQRPGAHSCQGGRAPHHRILLTPYYGRVVFGHR